MTEINRDFGKGQAWHSAVPSIYFPTVEPRAITIVPEPQFSVPQGPIEFCRCGRTLTRARMRLRTIQVDVQPADGFGVLLPGEERWVEATFSPASSVSHNSTMSFRTSLGQTTPVR